MFGSRAINLEFTSNFWAYLVCMQVIDMHLRQKMADHKPKKRRTNAYEVRDETPPDSGQNAVEADQPSNAAEEAEQRYLPSPLGQRKRKRSDLSMAKAREKRRRLKHHRS